MNAFSQLQLNDQLLTDLYARSLYHISEGKPVADPVRRDTSFVRFLGGNARNILIVVRDDHHPFLGEAEMNLLAKMLEACKMNMGDVAIVNLATISQTIDEVLTELHPEAMVLFGVDGSSAPRYVVTELSGVRMLPAERLSDLLPTTDAAKTAKQQLWNGLKTLFNLH